MLSRVRRVSLEDLRNNYDAVAYLKQIEARLVFLAGFEEFPLRV